MNPALPIETWQARPWIQSSPSALMAKMMVSPAT